MWNARNAIASALDSATGTLENDVSETERPNARPNTVSVTLLEDRRQLISFTQRHTGSRGQELWVSPRSAAALERAGTVVRVNTAKMGEAQRRLLLTLFELTMEAEQPPLGHFILRLPKMDGALRYYEATRLPWSSAAVTDLDSSSARSSVAQALANLERRGLVLRYPRGGKRTQQVELTQAGRRVAKGLTSNL